MNCPACGRDVTGKKFCPICGRRVEQEMAVPTPVQKPDETYVTQSEPVQKTEEAYMAKSEPVRKSAETYVPRNEPVREPASPIKPIPQSVVTSRPVNTPTRQVPQKLSKTGLMIAVCIIVALAIVIAGVFLFMSIYNSGGEDAPVDTPRTEVVTKDPEGEQTPPQPEFPRNSTYSSGYTYNNMQEIHSSEEAEDKEAFEMQDVVTNFNNAWVEYVNSGDTSVFSYLRAGTQAYKYAVAYGAKDIHEEYILMEVNDVRKYADAYYVWTHEIIEEASTLDSTDVKRFEYHWVYKVSYSGGGYYIENYISDPAYK